MQHFVGFLRSGKSKIYFLISVTFTSAKYLVKKHIWHHNIWLCRNNFFLFSYVLRNEIWVFKLKLKSIRSLRETKPRRSLCRSCSDDNSKSRPQCLPHRRIWSLSMVSHVVPSEACGGGGASEAAKNQKPIAAVEAKSNRQREIPAESPGLGYGGVVEVKTKNRRLWAALSRDEIEEDVFSTSGNRPSQSTAKEDEDLAEISRCYLSWVVSCEDECWLLQGIHFSR